MVVNLHFLVFCCFIIGFGRGVYHLYLMGEGAEFDKTPLANFIDCFFRVFFSKFYLLFRHAAKSLNS